MTLAYSMTRQDEIRDKALQDLQQYQVLMLNGHFDFGNGYHGRAYLNPHQLFRYPSTIWRFAQDLLDVIPSTILESTEVVAGPVTGGALLAHTIAGLLDSRRDLRRPPTLFAPFADDGRGGHSLSSYYRKQIAGRRVLLADDVRNTGLTFSQCAALVRQAGGTVVATCEIYDRLEASVDIGVTNISLAGYRAPENYKAESCPLCQAGTPVTSF
jgi:orotate phosphoribosyltransferase